MPTVEENLRGWDVTYDWKRQGEEWSSAWGSSEAQWFGTILPRIHRFLPAETILEIAPGYGRWTEFLKANCQRLEIVDLSENCVQACRKRFANETHIGFHVNDGRSLAMIADRSIDLAFSFDSLVHVEADVIEAYLRELAKKLKPNGVAFVHHSNAGSYRHSLAACSSMPTLLQKGLIKMRLFDPQQGRALSMTAKRFEECARAAELQCVSQELINWNSRRLIDCISIVTPRSSRRASVNRTVRNSDFMKEADSIRRMAAVYVMN